MRKLILALAIAAVCFSGCKKDTNNTATATCTDGIKNGNETGVDCGGSCPACAAPSCTDGIQNQGETSVDCGGPCVNADIFGTWQVYKYTLFNIDKTAQFANTYPNYLMSLNSNRTFSESYGNPSVFAVTGRLNISCDNQTLTLNASNGIRQYTILNLTQDQVQLRNDSALLFMSKP